jgi:cytochrome P450
MDSSAAGMIAVPVRAVELPSAHAVAPTAREERAMVVYNPFSEEVMADPYPVYRRLRDEAPVYRLPNYPCWALSRFEDVWNASMDARSFSVAGGTTPSQLLTKAQPSRRCSTAWIRPSTRRSARRCADSSRPRGSASSSRRSASCSPTRSTRLVEKGGGDLVGEFATRVALTRRVDDRGIPLEDGEMLYQLVKRFFGHEEGVDGMSPTDSRRMRRCSSTSARARGAPARAGHERARPARRADRVRAGRRSSTTQ